ncbi:MAG: lactonase family protein [Actinomycetota bacterium]|nr:lactonase family protein [Actinomycetota bacterium]
MNKRSILVAFAASGLLAFPAAGPAAALPAGIAGIPIALPGAGGAPATGADGQAKAGGSDGNLYAATNGLLGNAIRTFHRNPDGTLRLVGDTPTGGTGSNTFESSANGVVLGGLTGESSPNNLTDQEKFLFAVNTGSNSVSVLRANGDRPKLIETEATGGHPLSVTVSRNLVYVLNGGLTNGMGLPPSITGYRLSPAGTLTPIPGSTQPVSGGVISGSTQVSFNPAGDVLVVTEKTANVISTYRVGPDGVAGPPITNANSPGSVGPFGFTFTKAGQLLSAQNFGGLPLLGGASSFTINADGTLTPLTSTISNGQSDTCWIVVTDDQRFAFTTNAQSNTISSYRVGPDGRLTLLAGVAARTDELPGVGPTILPADITLSRDSRFLYERNVMDGDVNAYAVGSDGSLTLLQRINGALPLGAIGVAGA